MSHYSDTVQALNPSSYWRFYSGSPLADSGTGGITLTAVGTPTRTGSIIPSEAGSPDNAYDLNGTSMYLTAGDNYEFTGEIDWTIALWLKSDDVTGFRRLLEKRDTTAPNAGWTLYQSGGGNFTFDIDFGATAEGSTEAAMAPSGVVSFVAVSWVDSTTTLSFYRDGVLLGTDNTWTTAPGFPASGTTPLTIGASGSGGSSTDGIIDDVAIWSGTAISAANILAMYRAGTAKSPHPPAFDYEYSR